MQADGFMLPVSLVMVAVIIWAGLTVTSRGVQDVVRAKAFEVLDDQGALRIVLMTSVDGSPSVKLRDRDGKCRGYGIADMDIERELGDSRGCKV